MGRAAPLPRQCMSIVCIARIRNSACVTTDTSLPMFRMEISILLSQGTRSTTSSPEDRSGAEPVVGDGFPMLEHGSSVVVGVVTVGCVVNASRTASRTVGIKTAVMTNTTTGATNIASFCSREMLAHCSRRLGFLPGSFICVPLECTMLSQRDMQHNGPGQRGTADLRGPALPVVGRQLGGQGVKVDLLMQPGTEHLDGPAGVVATPVEAPVDRLLDAPAGRLERRGHRQGRPGHHQRGVLAEQLAEPEDATPASSPCGAGAGPEQADRSYT